MFPHRLKALSENVIGGFLVVLFLCDLVQEKGGKGTFLINKTKKVVSPENSTLILIYLVKHRTDVN